LGAFWGVLGRFEAFLGVLGVFWAFVGVCWSKKCDPYFLTWPESDLIALLAGTNFFDLN
jgi:hypothetical protein